MGQVSVLSLSVEYLCPHFLAFAFSTVNPTTLRRCHGLIPSSSLCLPYLPRTQPQRVSRRPLYLPTYLSRCASRLVSPYLPHAMMSWPLVPTCLPHATIRIAPCNHPLIPRGPVPTYPPHATIRPARHVEDYIAALDYVRGPSLTGVVDSSRVALWGTSFAGGHVLNVAAADDVPSRVGDIRAIISQVIWRWAGGCLSADWSGGWKPGAIDWLAGWWGVESAAACGRVARVPVFSRVVTDVGLRCLVIVSSETWAVCGKTPLLYQD